MPQSSRYYDYQNGYLLDVTSESAVGINGWRFLEIFFIFKLGQFRIVWCIELVYMMCKTNICRKGNSIPIIIVMVVSIFVKQLLL